MAKCAPIQRQNRHVCLGDMREAIKLWPVSIGPTAPGGVDYTRVYTAPVTIKALVKSSFGAEITDGVTVQRVGTTEFFVRYRSTLDRETRIEYRGDYYEILDIDDLDGRHEFMRVRTTKRGLTTKGAAQ